MMCVLQPFQHYLSHIKTMEGDNRSLCAMKHCAIMSWILCPHYENIPIQIYWKFHHQTENFQIKILITKACLYNFDPLKPHFYIVKLGFTGVYIIFLISAQKHRLWYSLELPHWGSSNMYPQSIFRAEILKISEFFYLKIFQFLQVKFSIYLNTSVFVMDIFHISAQNI